MPIDFVAREPHFIDHLAPIFAALPESERGIFYTTRTLLAHATKMGIHTRACTNRVRLIDVLRRRKGPLVTASYGDLRLTNACRRPQIFHNHGVGFRFTGNFPNYSGSAVERDNVVLFISPSRQSAEFETQACPWAEAVAIGCPKMDVWHNWMQNGWSKVKSSKPTVAISFHFDAGPVPELRSAFPYYRSILKVLAESFHVVGHAHPKWGASVRRIYEENGIRYEPNFDRILEIADIYVCDASSTIYEFASTDRPVVLLNAPWYRRYWIHPGNPRFWEHVDVGLQCDSPESLVSVVSSALQDPPEARRARRAAVDAVYEVCDGTATSLAVEAILDVNKRLSSGELTLPSKLARTRPKPSIPDKKRCDTICPNESAARFGIVTTNRNRTQNLEDCLRSISSQSLKPDWVVIADLGSDEESNCTLKWLARRYGVSYIRIEYEGPWVKGLAFNTAVRYMPRASHVIQLDADMIMAPDLLQHTDLLLKEHEAVAHVARFSSRFHFESGQNKEWESFNKLLARSRRSRSAWAIGGYIVLPHDWIVSNRGMDEAYVGWGLEDSDIWWRATTTLRGHVEADSYRLIHQSHPKQLKKKPDVQRNKERFYRRLLGYDVPTNPEGWGEAPVSEKVVRLGIQSNKETDKQLCTIC